MNARARSVDEAVSGSIGSVSGAPAASSQDVMWTPLMSMVPYWAVMALTCVTALSDRLRSRRVSTSPPLTEVPCRLSVAPFWMIRSALSSHRWVAASTRVSGADGQSEAMVDRLTVPEVT